MTENKRFCFVYNDGVKYLTDNEKVLPDNIALDLLNKLNDENEQLKSENQRLIDKLNQTALELVDNCISQGKASEISEMSYSEFLDYRAKNGKPMELRE